MYLPEWQNHNGTQSAQHFERVECYINEDGLTLLEPEFLKHDSQKEHFKVKLCLYAVSVSY